MEPLVLSDLDDLSETAALLLGRMGKAAKKTRPTLEEILSAETDRRLLDAIENALRRIPR